MSVHQRRPNRFVGVKEQLKIIQSKDQSERPKMISPGDRVRICAKSGWSLEQLHTQNHFPWNLNMIKCIGKIGLVRSISSGKIKVTFVNASSMKDFASSNKALNELSFLWHRDALRSVKNVYFAKGDKIVIIENNDLERKRKACIEKVFDDGSLWVRNTESTVLLWTQSNRPNDIILPVYGGNEMIQLTEELNVNLSELFVRLTSRVSSRDYVNTQSATVNPFLMKKAIEVWAETDDNRMFSDIVIRYPSLVDSIAEGKTPLLRTVELDMWPACEFLLAFGVNYHSIDEEGNSLIHLAAKNGSAAVVEGLLATSYINPLETNKRGETVLHCAISGGCSRCMNLLSTLPRLNLNQQDKGGNTILHKIVSMECSAFQLATLKCIISRPGIYVSMQNKDGFTPLHIAIKDDKLEVLKILMDANSHFMSGNIAESLTPLQLAATYGRAAILKMLLSNHHNIRRITRRNRTPLHFAVERWENSADNDMERMTCIQELVAHRIPINICDSTGATALHLVIPKFSDDMILSKAVFDSLVRVNRLNVRLEQIASLVKPHWPFAVACFLTILGADLNIKDCFGRTPLSLIKQDELKNFFKSISPMCNRPCISFGASTTQKSDSTSDTLCIFNCEGNGADIIFKPCGHRVCCTQCAKETKMRRCPLCYMLISSAENSDGKVVEMCAAITFASKFEIECRTKEEHERAIKARDEQVRELQEKLNRLEMEVNCPICLERRSTLVFQCGHAICSECDTITGLTHCHICRQKIKSRTTIYT